MRIGKPYILVQIDSSAQAKKREETAGGIKLHPNFVFMERNLQYGRVIQIGEHAAINYPEAEVGDEIVFHHSVEDDDGRILELGAPYTGWDGREFRDKYIFLDARDLNSNYEIYGVVKQTGEVIASRHHIWLIPDVTKIKMRMYSDLLHLETEMGDDWDSRERIEEKIAELDEERQALEPAIKATRIGYTLKQELDRRTEVINEINKKQEERGRLSKLLHQKRMGIGTIFAINSEVTAMYPELVEGSHLIVPLPLYPLEIYNYDEPQESAQFMIAHSNMLIGYTDNREELTLSLSQKPKENIFAEL